MSFLKICQKMGLYTGRDAQMIKHGLLRSPGAGRALLHGILQYRTVAAFGSAELMLLNKCAYDSPVIALYAEFYLTRFSGHVG